jgi:hypothetical protein
MSRRVASTTFGLPSKRRTFWAVERPLGAACSSFTPLTASRHTWHAEQIRRMRNGMGRPRKWIAADVVRVADGVLAEHWDVLQDEATRAELKEWSANVRHSVPRANADCIPEQMRCSAFHISKACPPAYKVFFAGAREDYIVVNESICDRSRASKRRARAPPSMLCR